MDARQGADGRGPAAQECRELIDSLVTQVTTARALRETAIDLRQYNAELRELLRENRLMSLSLKERWEDEDRLPTKE